MRRSILALVALLGVVGLTGCGEAGPPKDNSNIQEPPAPAPPGGPAATK